MADRNRARRSKMFSLLEADIASRFYEYTAFCNGPDEVKSPSDCHAAELTLLSVVSAEAATRCY